MTDDFDLDGYLKRIGYNGPQTPDLATLKALHAAHPEAIPFENLDPFLKRAPLLDLPSLQEKLVARRRGGYCFEQNLLLEAALNAIGFKVTKYLGRVRWMAPPERPEGPLTHVLLHIDLDEGPYLADVGFGSHMQAAPLKLAANIEQKSSTGLLRLIPFGRSFILQTRLPSGWQDMYRFAPDPQTEADCELGNWFTGAHPKSLFQNNLLAERLDQGFRHILFNTDLTTRDQLGQESKRKINNAKELGQILDEIFHITPPASATEIWNRLPKG